MGNINQLKYRGIYSKVLLKTEVKSLKFANIYKKHRRYKDFY